MLQRADKGRQMGGERSPPCQRCVRRHSGHILEGLFLVISVRFCENFSGTDELGKGFMIISYQETRAGRQEKQKGTNGGEMMVEVRSLGCY